MYQELEKLHTETSGVDELASSIQAFLTDNSQVSYDLHTWLGYYHHEQGFERLFDAIAKVFFTGLAEKYKGLHLSGKLPFEHSAMLFLNYFQSYEEATTYSKFVLGDELFSVLLNETFNTYREITSKSMDASRIDGVSQTELNQITINHIEDECRLSPYKDKYLSIAQEVGESLLAKEEG
ncbi:hypothetical protein [Vibrio crassostreae]|uniref:hypothetical protein n=1 Tax=Vibrio crassostreae TaxID=246167 RepID=UPI001B316DB6|nr:hypothetical protein [Vibrio crassostreae]